MDNNNSKKKCRLLSKWALYTLPALQMFYGCHHDWLTVTEYLCHQWPLICSVCRNYNPILFCIIYQCIFKRLEMITRQEHLCSFVEFMLFNTFDFCLFCETFFIFLFFFFSFDHYIVRPSSNHRFWLALW
jgi:hypothetical protein